MTINLVFHARTKHVEIDYHFAREKVALGALVTQFVTSANEVTNIFTKPLPCRQFTVLRSKLGLWPPPQPSLRGHINSLQADPEVEMIKELVPQLQQ